MSKKIIKTTTNSLLLSLLSVLAFVYIMLFEFILPVNKFLPRPSVLIESFPSLINDYNFINSFISTFSIIYSTFLISYFIMKLFFPVLVKISIQFPKFVLIFNASKYFIPLFLILIFELWFGSSVWGEIFFVIVIVNCLLKGEIFQKSLIVKEEYILSAKSLGLSQEKIIKEYLLENIAATNI